MKRAQLEANVLILVTLGLVAFGLVMVYSATSARATVGDGEPMYYLTRQAIFALAGLAALVVCARTPYAWWRRAAPTLLAVTILLLAAVLVLGDPVNGARRWLPLGPFVFQPSEAAKLALAVWTAAYLSRSRTRPPTTLGELAKPLGLVAGVSAGLILLEPDLGTAIAVVLMLGGILVAAGAPVSLLARAGAIVVFLGVAAIWLEPYRRERILSFFNPWSDAQGAGFQSVQALIGLGSGGVLGKGIGEGVQKIFYLPEAHTDMIFATIGEELGLIGTVGVIAAFAAFCWAGMRIAVACPDRFGSLLAAGLTVLIGAQAATNLAAVLGLAPVTGITLPFVSYGGSSLVVALAGAGILLNIAGTDARAKRAEVPDRSRGTGGHVLPSLAVAEALSARGAHVTFAGSPGRAEAQLVPEAGYELDTFEIAGFPRRPSADLVRSLLLAGRAPLACRRILERRRPHVVLGGGGYVAGPMVVAAATRRIPSALMEADAHLGLANRLAAPFAKRVFLAFPIPGREGGKYRVTGRPVPARAKPVPRDDARSEFELPAEGPLLLVYGGSQGARSLNELVVDTFGKEGPLVLHLAGERDYEELKGRVRRDGYRLLAYTHHFGAALAAADLALARAGGSVYELAGAGVPAVLVPYPHATADHQTKNALHFERAGAAVLVAEAELGRVPGLVMSLLEDVSRRDAMAAAMRRVARPAAADEIAEEVLALAAA